jgi:peptide/nickel transport system substrate-binding protein
MQRRKFITLLGSGAAFALLAAVIPVDSLSLERLVAAFRRRAEVAGSFGVESGRHRRQPGEVWNMEDQSMKILRLAAFASALLLSLQAGAHAQTTLRIGLAEDPDILDPSMARTYVGRIVFAAFCDKLFDIDEKLNIVPQLALSHETSADGKEMTIKLRPGVKFHDGEPIDAEAAKFSIERHLTLQGSFRKPELATVDHVDVVDPLTIKLVLKTPFSPLIAQLTDRAGMMVSPKAAKEEGDKFGLHPVCAGPYKFVERVQQDRIVFEKFADYWNKDNVFIDRVVYLPIVDATVRLANLKSGGLDLIERVLATDIKAVRADSRLKLSTALGLGYLGLTINIAKDKNKGPLSQSEKVRQALELSIDREAINQVVFNGEFTPGNQWVSPEHPYYQKAFPIGKRDIAKAKALLKESGAALPVSVDLMVPKGAESEAVAQVIQSMAAEAGFDLKLRVIEFATSFKQAQAGEFQAFLIGWSGRIDPDGNSYVFMHTGAPQNDGGYSNPEADKALEDARLITDPAQRKAIYEKLTRIVLNDEPLIYLTHGKFLIAHTTKLEGYKQMPDGLVRVIGVKFK